MLYTQVFNSHPVSAGLAGRLAAMPKVELHIHLEGATDAGLIFDMAKRNRVDLPAATLEEWLAFYEFRDFDHFIDVYMMATSCMRTAQDFADMVVHFLSRQAAQHILYSEVFFSPALHQGKLPDSEILAALAEGARLGQAKYASRVAFIFDISRQLVLKDNLQAYVLDFALQAREQGIGIGLGIGGKEIGYPPELFRDVFAEARRQGLHVVAHAGETDGPQSVRGALEALQVERIGHGLRALEDARLVQELRQRQTPLDVSPQSNYCTRVVQRDQPHPLRRMLDEGLYCTLSSDDPPMFSTDLNNEYLTLAAQGLTFSELWQLNCNGVEASFLGQPEKAKLRKIYADYPHIPDSL